MQAAAPGSLSSCLFEATRHTTNGRCDIIAGLRADSLEDFDKVLRRIRLVEGIAHSETNLLLSTYKL